MQQPLWGIDRATLTRLVLETFRVKPQSQLVVVVQDVERLAQQEDVFPTEAEARERGISFDAYKQRELSPVDELNISEVLWDLIAERVLTVGQDRNNPNWPLVRLTAFGWQVIRELMPPWCDPDGYVSAVLAAVPHLDGVIAQYLGEGVRAYKQRLFFASAVALGAASEKAILLLLESIGDAETDAGKKRAIADLLEHGRLPAIFATVQSTVEKLAKAGTLPYKVHEGSVAHLLSLFETIRVQRNDAVHPAAGQVSKEKVFLAIQGLPAALAAVYKLTDWFKGNQI